ncbi:alpha/beta hydrolase [Flavobacterium lindanitolerans]|uniref:alpha/beta hydrolase n=1 Tax=Flavobacterium lindanitolerans TaxID=428988 RepID=UPI0027B97674|nr:alpha/beta hydrolase [Flavobacterium lindanitolerans]
MKKILIAFLFLLSFHVGNAQKMTTLTYFQNDTIKLDLDLFLPEKTSGKKLPLLLYVHGGGFSGGERQSGHSLCRYITQNGYASATITYTLYAKGKKFSCDGILSEKIKAFQYAVNDLWLATSFFIKNSEKYAIDTSKIFIAGSSAGAETVLHAAFWDFKTMNLYDNSLPAGFKYAGLVSGAGAIMDLNLITEKNIIPMFFFHGNGDTTVPYATAPHHYCKTNASGWLMLFGSYSIYNHIVSLDGSGALYTFCGGGHEYSGYLFEKEHHIVLNFLNDVSSGKKFQKHDIVPTGKKNELSATYKFCD